MNSGLNKVYDAVVIGAGPAGSSFAYHASRAGLSVLLVEKQREVAHTILCAEGVSSEFLKLLGEERFTRNFVASYVYGGILTHNGKKIAEVSFSEPVGAVLERKIFDRYLVERAVVAGSDIKVNTRFIGAERKEEGIEVHLLSGGREIRLTTHLIVGADGPASGVAKSLGLFSPYNRNYDFFTTQIYAYCEDIRDNYLYFGVGEKVAPLGYGWIFPKGGGFANIGVGIPGKRENLEEYLNTFLQKHCRTIKILGITHGVVPTGFHKRKIFGDNVLILGDAARLADPLTGGGIANAYISGMVAAKAAEKAKKEGDFSEKVLKAYWKELKKWIFPDYMVTLYAKNFYHSLSPEELEELLYSIKDIVGKVKVTPPVSPLGALLKIIKKDPALLFRFGSKGFYAAKESLREFI